MNEKNDRSTMSILTTTNNNTNGKASKLDNDASKMNASRNIPGRKMSSSSNNTNNHRQTSSGGTIISPPIPSGASHMKIPMLVGFVVLTSVYYGVLAIFPTRIATWLPPSAPEFCSPQEEGYCQRPDLFAFQMASGVALLFCGIVGFVSWHISQVQSRTIPATPEGRLFGHIPQADWLCAASVTFQLWDLILSAMIPEHCTAIMLGHHTLAAMIAWYGLNNQVCTISICCSVYVPTL